MEPLDVHHLVPDVHLFTQEALQNLVGEEHSLEVEVRTDHQVGNHRISRNHSYLVLPYLNHLTVHLALHTSAGTDCNGTHLDVSVTDGGELLDAIDNNDVVIRVPYMYSFICGKGVE